MSRGTSPFFLRARDGSDFFTNSLSGAQQSLPFPIVVPGILPRTLAFRPLIIGGQLGVREDSGARRTTSLVSLQYVNRADLSKALFVIEDDDVDGGGSVPGAESTVRGGVVVKRWITVEKKIFVHQVEDAHPSGTDIPLGADIRTLHGQWNRNGAEHLVVAYGFTDDEFWSLVDSMITK